MICDDTDTPHSHVIYSAMSRAERQLCFNHVTALSADQQLIYYEELPMTSPEAASYIASGTRDIPDRSIYYC